jgi:hypothetical protein
MATAKGAVSRRPRSGTRGIVARPSGPQSERRPDGNELRDGSRNAGVDALKLLLATGSCRGHVRPRHLFASSSERTIPRMRLYALVEAGDPEAIDVYLCEEDAQRALKDCLRDEPQ